MPPLKSPQPELPLGGVGGQGNAVCEQPLASLQRTAKRAAALFILLVPNISSTGEHRFFCPDTPTFRPKVTRKM